MALSSHLHCLLEEGDNGSTPCTGRQLTYLGLTVLWRVACARKKWITNGTNDSVYSGIMLFVECQGCFQCALLKNLETLLSSGSAIKTLVLV